MHLEWQLSRTVDLPCPREIKSPDFPNFLKQVSDVLWLDEAHIDVPEHWQFKQC